MRRLLTILAMVLFFSVSGRVTADITPATDGDCLVGWQTQSAWESGFTIDPIQIVNNMNESIQGWELVFELAGDQTVTGAWNVDFEQDGRTVTLSSTGAWTDVIEMGDSYSFGLQGTHSTGVVAPTEFVLNGKTCIAGVIEADNEADNNNQNQGARPTQPSQQPQQPQQGEQAIPIQNRGQNVGVTTRLAPARDERYNTNECTDRFFELYDELHDPVNGYFDAEGIPYHSIETLIVEAPDYGHETTSEAYSYWLLLEAAYGKLTDNWARLAYAWDVMEATIIPQEAQQPTVGDYTPDTPATFAPEFETPDQYPAPLKVDVPIGRDPIAAELVAKHGARVYGMHWLLDVDNWYGYGDEPAVSTYINTFQRGEQESVWETVPHPSWDDLSAGDDNGFLPLFTDDPAGYKTQWRYTNATDADARAVEAVYFAKMWADAQGGDATVDALVPKAAKMGDWLRYGMFDKYFKPLGCQSEDCPAGNGYDSAHYLMAWYYAWGGPLVSEGWSWRIGSSHVHFGYQNPVAALALSTDANFSSQMATNGARDWGESLERQLQFYKWLQSAEGAIAGGATNSWNGRYEAHPAGTPTFYGMAYDENPVYHDPGSNTWFGFQVWSMQRVAEYYYLTADERVEPLLKQWVDWARREIEYDVDGAPYAIPVTLAWTGTPDADWSGGIDGNKDQLPPDNQNLHVTVEAKNRDIGVTASLVRTLLYWAEAADDTAARDDADKLLNLMWDNYRDEQGLAVVEKRGDYARFNDPVSMPFNFNGVMGQGETAVDGATFLELRTQYEDDPAFSQIENKTYTFTYHRFWAQVEAALAYAECGSLGSENQSRIFPGFDQEGNEIETETGDRDRDRDTPEPNVTRIVVPAEDVPDVVEQLNERIEELEAQEATRRNRVRTVGLFGVGAVLGLAILFTVMHFVRRSS